MSVYKKRFILNIIMVSLLVCGALFLNGNGGDVKADTNEVYKDIEVFTEVLRQIEKNYVEPEKPHKLISEAIKGMVRGLDPHSSFMTKEEYEELMLETKGSFSGIGIEITLKDNILTVVSPIEGTPAFKVGIKAGDKIIKVENKSTKDMTLMEAVKTIRGAKGSKVNLTVLRKGELEPLVFSITRDVIPLISVRHFLLTPDICYVRISNFQSKTAHDLSEALEDVEKGHQLKGMILDLRNNPGGLLSQAIEVSDLFLNSGIIVSTKGRNPAQDIIAKARDNVTGRNYPILVLVNGGSASAAEIVAGALKDNKRALILGTRTFGKGSVQTIMPLPDGSGLRLTTALYYTPSGISIQSSGIDPDITLAFVPPDDKIEKKPIHFLREENLEGHMLNKTEKNKKATEKAPEEKKDQRATILLEKDNQVRYGLELLKTWDIFSTLKSEQQSVHQ